MEANYNEQLKNWMNEWKTRFEEMQVQFSLGKMDAADLFEKQKEQLRNALVTLKTNMDNVGDTTEAQLQQLRTKIEELQVQLALGKAEGADVFAEQKKKIEHAMDALKAEAKQSYNEGFTKAMNMFEHNSNAFKIGIEIIQLQFALGKMDAKDDADKLRAELTEKINAMQKLFADGQKMAAAQMDEWNKQWQAGFDKMKTWAEYWTKK